AVAPSQNRTLGKRPGEAIRPSRNHATAATAAVWPSQRLSRSPDSRSQTRITQSSPPPSNRWPSGEKATLKSGESGRLKEKTDFRAIVFQTCRVPSRLAEVARAARGAKATQVMAEECPLRRDSSSPGENSPNPQP